MKQGIYKVSGVTHSPAVEKARHYGRIAIVNGHTHVLEDTKDGFLSRAFPDGVVDDMKQRRWASLVTSPYFRVSTEGLIDQDAKDMPHPEVKPEEVFDVVDEHGTRQVLEAFGENLFLDNKRLDPRGVEELHRRIQLGELHLLPRAQP